MTREGLHGARALLLAALACVARPAAAADIGALWNEMFSPDEQRILHTLKADPAEDRAMRAGLGRVVAAEGDADRFEAEKRRFQLEWLGKVSEFSAKFKAGDAALLGKPGLTKPSAEQAAKALPWVTQIDKAKWGGKLVPAVIAQLNPYEASFALARLGSLHPDDQAAVVKKLGMASAFGLDAGAVAAEVVKSVREKMTENLARVEADYATKSATVKGQLEAAQRLLARAATGNEEALRGSGDQAFDGKGPATGGPVPPGSGDAPPVPAGDPSTWVASPKPSGALEPAPDPGKKADAVAEVPPPEIAPDKEPSAEKDGGGAGIGAMLKSPIVTGALGAIGLGLAGFFLFGPIGALIGAAVGFFAGQQLPKLFG